MAVAILQVALGIATLLLHVPVAIASMHQAGALLLFSTLLYLNQQAVAD
jgi:cytochrome c oxidase assembly protein subunit 15